MTDGFFNGDDMNRLLENMKRAQEQREAIEASWPNCPNFADCASKVDPQATSAICAFCQEKRRELSLHVSKVFGKARVPERYKWARFADEQLSQRVKDASAIEQARKWDGADRLLFVGPVGIGKTSLAVATLVSQIRLTTTSAVFVDVFELAMARKRIALGTESELVDNVMNAHVAVIDDIGSEPKDHTSTVAHVLFERHQHMRPTILTTWATSAQLSDIYGAGIARRVYEHSALVRMTKGGS